MSRVVYFELNVADAARSIPFYEEAMGWKITRSDIGGAGDYWMVSTGSRDSGGIDGGLMATRDGQPRTVNIVRVPDVDEALAKIIRAGGQVVEPKMSIPTVGWIAYCADPGGLIFGVWQPVDEMK
jgi:uncharacterized protein